MYKLINFFVTAALYFSAIASIFSIMIVCDTEPILLYLVLAIMNLFSYGLAIFGWDFMWEEIKKNKGWK